MPITEAIQAVASIMTTRGITMATSTIVLEIKSRWWVPVYLRTLTMLCILIRQEPDYDKVADFIVRYGISKKVKACRNTQ